MIPDWTHHLKTKEEKDRFEKYLYGSRNILDVQSNILDKFERELDDQENNPDQYNSPSWAALQADRNGYRRALRRIKKLITLDKRQADTP
jgi:hypothetical protein